MANGTTLSEIREILSDKQKVAQGVVNRLTLSLLSEIYQKQLDMSADEKLYRREIERRLFLLESRSVGLWIWAHPKSATAILISLYSFAISDIRQPIFEWLTEAVKLIF